MKTQADAERQAVVARLEASLNERYLIRPAPVKPDDLMAGQTEYRLRGDTTRVAFTASTFRLATGVNSPSVARSMVDVVQARNWKGLRLAGSEDFRRTVWLEASVRGVKALGFEPDPADLALFKREREARQAKRIQTTVVPDSSAHPASHDKNSTRGGARKAVLAAIDAVLVAKRVPEAKRGAVLEAAIEQLAQRSRAGQPVRVKIYDRTAPAQGPSVAPMPEISRTRDRAAPSPTR
jgi:hypothetical protein